MMHRQTPQTIHQLGQFPRWILFEIIHGPHQRLEPHENIEMNKLSVQHFFRFCVAVEMNDLHLLGNGTFATATRSEQQ